MERTDPIRRKTEAILLNGPSSAGKSSIARALRRKLSSLGIAAKIVSLDDHLHMSAEEPIWEDDVYETVPKMCEEIRAALGEGRTLIVDHVITSPRIYDALLEAFAGHPMKSVLVTCDPEFLREREKARGDRYAGSAEASLRYLYPRTGYDLRLDSGAQGPEALAETILGIL